MGFGMWSLVRVAVLFLHCWAMTADVGAATCPDGWIKRNNYCYYFSSSAENQGYAVAKCHNMSAFLASIHDIEENTFVTNTTQAVGYNHWLGMQRKSENSGGSLEWKRNDWRWYDETNLDFVNWGELQPNEDNLLCAVVKQVTGFWDDLSCNDLHRFICKKALTQLPTSTGESMYTTPSTPSTTPTTKQPSTHSTTPFPGINSMPTITGVSVDHKETTPTNTGTLGEELISRSLGKTTRQLDNTSTSKSSGLAATTATTEENQMGKRESESGFGLYIGAGAAFIGIVVLALVITIIMCRRRNTKSNSSGTTSKSSVQADGDFVFVQNNIASPHQAGAANHFTRRQGNAQHHQYDNVNISDLRTFKQGASNLDGKSSDVTPPPAAMLDVAQQRTQATSVTVNSNQEIEVLYAKPIKKQNRANASTHETMSTDRTDIEYQENCLYQSERMGDDMIVVENDIYG